MWCAELGHVPVVVLVLEGGHMTLNTAYQAIKTETPVLVMAGSGRAADFIANAYEKPSVQRIVSLNYALGYVYRGCLISRLHDQAGSTSASWALDVNELAWQRVVQREGLSSVQTADLRLSYNLVRKKLHQKQTPRVLESIATLQLVNRFII